MRKDGLYFYNYRDPVEGKRRTIYARTLPELREKEAELQRKLAMNLDVVKARKMTRNAI